MNADSCNDQAISRRVRIRILVEDNTESTQLRTEHGLSIWIETDSGSILFDTGQSRAFAENAAQLGIALNSTDALVLSHGHYDYTGGVPYACVRSVFFHPDVLLRRYSRKDGLVREIGIPADAAFLIQRASRLVWATQPTRVLSGVWTTGPIPRHFDFEDTGGNFYLDHECTRCDPLTDDQVLWLQTERGIVVTLGCAHSGVCNTLRYITELTRGQIFAVIGGLHLLNSNQERIQRTAEFLRNTGLKLLAPGNCTDPQALGLLRSAVPETVVACSAGAEFKIVPEAKESQVQS